MTQATEPSIKDLLLSQEEMEQKYQQLQEQAYRYPYTYKISKQNGSQVLYFLGVHHVYDPIHPQIGKIKDLWYGFIEETQHRNRIVLTEGGVRPVEKTEERAIITHGEAGLLAYLSEKEHIQNSSPEPDESYEVKELHKTFSKEDIEYTFFARSVTQWNKLKEKPDFHTYIQGFLDRDKSVFGWDDFEFTIDNLIAIHDKKNSHTFDPIRCEQCVYKLSNPSQNPVASASNYIRDEHIVKEIIQLWEKGYNIFIVYGSSHAIVCERSIRHFLLSKQHEQVFS